MRQRAVVAFFAAGALAASIGACSRGKSEAVEPQPAADDGGDPVAQQQRAACDQEIALECPDGMVDGCTRTSEDGAALTAYHVCLPAEEQASQPCEQEIARQCGEGLVDACLADPPAASTHVCIQATAEATEPGEPGEPSEPGEPGEPSEPGEPTEPPQPQEG
jgi:hypothetical protein